MFHYSKSPRRGTQIAEIARPVFAATEAGPHHQYRSWSDGFRLQRTVGNQGMMLLAQPQIRDSVRSQATGVPSFGTGAQGLGNFAPSKIAVSQSAPSDRIMRAPAEPYVRQVSVDLTAPQHVSLDWQGTPPEGARSTFRCSTGKGYGDPDDPPGICKRACCTPGANPCESPYDQKSSRGSCCTPIGNFTIQSKEREHAVEGGTIPFWMYFYSTRGIALHEYSPVDGTPLSHGCVRLDSVNAEMLFNHSYANTTRVNVSGAAIPACPAGQGVACTKRASTEPDNAVEGQGKLASAEREETDSGA